MMKEKNLSALFTFIQVMQELLSKENLSADEKAMLLGSFNALTKNITKKAIEKKNQLVELIESAGLDSASISGL